jgi:hypothetical protein
MVWDVPLAEFILNMVCEQVKSGANGSEASENITYIVSAMMFLTSLALM